MISAEQLNTDLSQYLQHLIPLQQKQARRLVSFLSGSPDANSGYTSSRVACGNISQIAKVANRYIAPAGYFISCRRPDMPINNRFNEPSKQFLWGVYSLPKIAANDGNIL